MKKVPFDLETFKKCGRAVQRNGLEVGFLAVTVGSVSKIVYQDAHENVYTTSGNGKYNPYADKDLDLTHCLVESKRRPYKSIEEVPVDHWFRFKEDTKVWYRVLSMRESGVQFSSSREPFRILANEWEHSPTISGPWEPCTVEDCE